MSTELNHLHHAIVNGIYSKVFKSKLYPGNDLKLSSTKDSIKKTLSKKGYNSFGLMINDSFLFGLFLLN